VIAILDLCRDKWLRMRHVLERLQALLWLAIEMATGLP